MPELIPQDFIDDLVQRIDVVEVIGNRLEIKKAGKEYKGLCPFHTEKTPSFTVNDEKEFYHCFATSEHGNIFDFLMKTQNLKFGEAVKSLANLAGMRPYTFSKQDEEREKNWKEYSLIYNQYVQFYHDELLKNEKANIAREYLKKRNLSKETVKKFKIGYVSKNPNFYEKIKKEFNEKTKPIIIIQILFICSFFLCLACNCECKSSCGLRAVSVHYNQIAKPLTFEN